MIYTGVLGLAFSVGNNPLPLRGLIPAFFLGLSIVMATAYIAYPTEPIATTDWPQEAGSVPENQRERTGAFIDWIADQLDPLKPRNVERRGRPSLGLLHRRDSTILPSADRSPARLLSGSAEADISMGAAKDGPRSRLPTSD